MPKKPRKINASEFESCLVSFRGFLVSEVEKLGGWKSAFEKVHGRPAIDNAEVTTFNNQITRNQMSLTMVMFWLDKFELWDVNLDNLFRNLEAIEVFKNRPKRKTKNH